MQTLRPVQLTKLQPELIRQVRALQEDLRERCDAVPEVGQPVRAEYEQAQKAGRTAETFNAWREPYLNQVAVAWVLTSLFVRYLEDNSLVDECWLAGEGARAAEVRERYSAYFRQHPEQSDRDYFLSVFERLAELPGCSELFGRARNPLWKIGISGDGARDLREFWQEVDPGSGELLRPLGGGTRFLGDLYQNLSEEAQKKYALLQTPDFIESFILDRTLEPAIGEFGLAEVRLIDPTCGSGHFLLGAFRRLFGHWQREAPSENVRVLARRALEAVYGVDINPFAVAIARFRLVIEYMRACGLSHLREMPDVHPRVATGDSLLHGNTICSAKGWGQHSLSDWGPDAFAEGDFEDAKEFLGLKYHAVVGNPPYIIDRDKAHNAAVRERYATAYQKFSLAVPFKEKFWDLAMEGRGGQRAGFVGMITANSFMKREFGSRLIKQFFPRVDLTHVLDTSGAYIPGHGTPTVILLGRNRSPILSVVRAVLGIRGEPSTPAEPAQGLVWQSIVRLLNSPGSTSSFISITDVTRETFGKHPWAIGGGGAAELKDKVESSAFKLRGQVASIGIASFTLEDDVFVVPEETIRRSRVEARYARPMVLGDQLRDYCCNCDSCAYFLYDDEYRPLPLSSADAAGRYFWVYRSNLEANVLFGSKTKKMAGMLAHEFGRLTHGKLRTPLSIAFAFVATHNHFVLDRGGKVFNRTAPVIKLPPGASEDDHLALLGVLNSSTACFWLKQVCSGKHMADGGEAHADPAYQRFEFDGSKLQEFPLPRGYQRLLTLPRRIQERAEDYHQLEPSRAFTHSAPNPSAISASCAKQPEIRQQMIALQEELDWLCYELFGLLEKAPLAPENDLPKLQLGQRAFEIALARSGEETTWFTRHNSTPITEIPAGWPASYRDIVQQRLGLIENNPEIALIEKPEHKRRWQEEPWSVRVQAALKTWLLNRIEDTARQYTDFVSTSQVSDRLAIDRDFRQALTLYLNTDDYNLTKAVTNLILPQSVPYLAALRYSDSGMRIRSDWERTWELQRRQDAGEDVGDIPVPPKYGQKDFLKSEFWQLRGKLDVPKERFISYPGAEREADSSPVIGWAGWDHLQRARALAAYFIERKDTDGWSKERLTPLLAGLAELLPWLKQWHNDLDPEMDLRMGDYFESFLEEQLRELHLSPAELAAWHPPSKVKSRRKS